MYRLGFFPFADDIHASENIKTTVYFRNCRTDTSEVRHNDDDRNTSFKGLVRSIRVLWSLNVMWMMIPCHPLPCSRMFVTGLTQTNMPALGYGGKLAITVGTDWLYICAWPSLDLLAAFQKQAIHCG
jgi:hypothetical protein